MVFRKIFESVVLDIFFDGFLTLVGRSVSSSLSSNAFIDDVLVLYACKIEYLATHDPGFGPAKTLCDYFGEHPEKYQNGTTKSSSEPEGAFESLRPTQN